MFGLMYLVFLATEPQIALIFGVILLVGYFLLKKQKKLKAAKEAEEKRKQAINLARQREDLYKYDPSVLPSDKRSTNNIWENSSQWSEAIQRRLKNAQKHLDDASLVFNDDVDQLTKYRKQLQNGLLKEYKEAIKPFYNDLLLRGQDLPESSELKVAINFRYPDYLQPAQIDKDINDIVIGCSQSISMHFNGRGFKNFGRADAISITIMILIHVLSYLHTNSQQRKELEKVQAQIDIICQEISGAIATYGRASEQIAELKKWHQEHETTIRGSLKTVSHLSKTGKKLSDLSTLKQKVITDCYIAAKCLEQFMNKDLIQAIGRSK